MRRSLLAVALSLGVSGCAGPQPAEPAVARRDGDPIVARQEAEASLSRGDLLLSRARRGGRVDAALVERAIAAYHDAVERDPLLFQAHLRLASCYYLLQRHDLEESEYRKCLAVNPRCLDAWEDLGHCRLAVDDLEGAREAYERVLALEPDHEVVLFNLHLVEQDLGERPTRAAELHERWMLSKQRRAADVTHD